MLIQPLRPPEKLARAPRLDLWLLAQLGLGGLIGLGLTALVAQLLLALMLAGGIVPTALIAAAQLVGAGLERWTRPLGLIGLVWLPSLILVSGSLVNRLFAAYRWAHPEHSSRPSLVHPRRPYG